MAEELPNLFDAVRKANREVWEQASGRKSRGKSDEVPQPTGRESPLEGADAIAMVAALSAKLRELQARVDYIEDDFPEPELMNEGQSGACWDGKAVDFYGKNILSVDITDPGAILGRYIVYHTGLSPTKHALATWPKDVSVGPWAWDMIVRGSPWISWEVGGDEVKNEAGNSYSPKRYELAVGKTCGTIHIPVPIATPNHRLAYQNIQMGAGSGTSQDDNGILAQYPRTH